jgi:drug/metabolite transporter (DMT)-like permease
MCVSISEESFGGGDMTLRLPSTPSGSCVSARPSHLALKSVPVVFVLIWSTGWIMAGFATRYADPLTFLTLRFGFASVLLGLFAVFIKARWPTTKEGIFHAVVSGLLLHGLYLGGTWWGIQHGVPTGISGLIAALQPLMTAILAPYLVHEFMSTRQKQGVALGFVGISLVLWPKAMGVTSVALHDVLVPLCVTVVSVVSLTLGTFYQKRFLSEGDLSAITVVQYAGCFVAMGLVAYFTEPMKVTWNMTIILSLAWSVFGLSFGAIGLLFFLLRKGEVSRTAALIYVVPPLTALQAYLFFNETLVSVQIVGFILTAMGVALAIRR